MADTIRQQIIDAVEARLKTIREGYTVTTFAGRTHTYACTITHSVYAWRTAPLTTDDIPGANVKDMQSSTILSIGAHKHTMEIQIDAFTTSDTDLRLFIGDITTCIGSDLTWGGLANDTKPIGDEDISVVQAGSVVAGCRLKIQIEYDTVPWDPFTAA